MRLSVLRERLVPWSTASARATALRFRAPFPSVAFRNILHPRSLEHVKTLASSGEKAILVTVRL